jgi:hypothetical protein
MASFWLSLLLKMLTSAALVVGASKIVERTGPFMGAMVATLPVSAGPAYAFLALDHGADFLARAALAGLPANAAIAVFIVTYAAMARRFGTAATLAVALAAWLVASSSTRLVPWTLASGLAVNAALYALAIAATWKWRSAGPVGPAASRAWDIPVRAGAVMALVAAVVLCGRIIGPEVAGLTAQAPVVLTSLALVLHPRIGGPPTAAVMVMALPGMIGFAVALAVLHVAAGSVGAAAGLSLGLLVSMLWNLGLVVLRGRATRRPESQKSTP